MIRFVVYSVVFGLGVLIGGGFPGYTIQYQQRLYAQFDQVTTDLKPFREIADRYHDGSLQALVNHHLKSRDPTFHDEGIAIQAMLLNQERLAQATSALASSPLEQVYYLYNNIDYDLAKTTWEAYTPMVVTTPEALTFAVSVGLILCAATFLLWRLARSLAGRPVGLSKDQNL
ncbi:MAG: DUF2937 family protein [Gammaproteobacteria bacterium]|nr:DUF2937 family protein [Gammaproteobacteria bacterium]